LGPDTELGADAGAAWAKAAGSPAEAGAGGVAAGMGAVVRLDSLTRRCSEDDHEIIRSETINPKITHNSLMAKPRAFSIIKSKNKYRIIPFRSVASLPLVHLY
jgi:hypothetical protein